jgi:hypothetical protein
LIHRSVHLLQLTARSVSDDFGPGLIRFAHRHGIGVTRSAVLSEGFIGNLGHVWSAHDDGNTRDADGICHAVRLGNHPGHSADPD